MTQKILVLGLELGSGTHIRDWCKAGLLPTFSDLLRKGRYLELETTASQLHVSAWPSLYTGVGPGEHGVYFTFQPARGLQGYQRFFDGIYGAPTFWSLLDRAGKHCIVFDAPYTQLEETARGIQLVDWGTWAHYLTASAKPEGVLRDLESTIGKYNLGIEAHDLGFKPLDPDRTADKLRAAVSQKGEATRWMLSNNNWDMAFIVFGETHVASHYCWQIGQENLGDPHANQTTMRSVYEEIDRAIADLIRSVGDDCTVLIVSGDAVGANNAGWHLLPDVLSKLGYFASADHGSESNQYVKKKKQDPVRLIRDLLPKDFRKNLARFLPTAMRDKLAQRVDTANFDWDRTKVYCLPTDLEGCLRVNLRGREPMGIVEPGREFDQLCMELTDALLGLRDPADDRAVVREVIRIDQTFPGDQLDKLPDLVVIWDDQRPIAAVTSDRIGTVEAPSPDPRTGTHKSPGFAILSGAEVNPSDTVEQGHIFDVAPSILSWLDVPIPETMKGQSWQK